MKIGITGASGFIGKRLVKKLEEDGFEVFKFVRRDVQNENEIFDWVLTYEIVNQDWFDEKLKYTNVELLEEILNELNKIK